MKTKSVLRTRRAGARKGFALITTVTILVLLSLIAIGLLSLSAVTVRSSSAELAKLEARANARLALMLAIGDLQKQLGPDQRVSAAAGILDESPESLSIEGVDQPFWTGVWSTEWLGDTGSVENKSPWVRNDLEGGLSDRRFEEGYDREKEVLNYLVSGNEGGRLERGDDMISAQNARLEENAILLVGPGTVEDGAGGGDFQEVLAPRVATWKNGRETGGYAFWVGDLGVKAHVAQVDEYSLDNPRRGNSPDGMERLVNAQDTAEEKIAGLGELDDDEARRTVSHKTLGLAQDIDKDDMKVAYHHITTNSKAVLANVRQGGLQRDLTAFLHSRGRISDLRANGRIVSQGLNDLDNMIGPANPNVADEQGTRWAQTKYRDIAPTFALLRNWSLMGSRFGYSESEHNMIAPAPAQQSALRGMNDGVNVYDGGNLRPASFLPFDKPNMFPVMVEGSIYYNLASYPDTPGAPNTQYNLRICYYPRIALWNPFNVELQTGPMVATIFVNGNKDVQVTGADGTRRNVPIPFGRGSTKVGAKPSAPDQSPGHYVGWILMNIAPTTMLPGETLVFSPERTQQYEISNVFRNTLSSSVAPDPAIYFWQDMQVKHTSPLASFVEFPGPGNQSGGDNYMMSLKDATSVRGRATDSSFNNLQSIVYANTSVQAGGSDELPVQWSARNPVPVYPLRSSRDRLPGTAIPDTRTRDGFRFRWWQEHASNIRGSGQLRRTPHHLQTSIIGTWNPRAAYFCRTPWDNVTDQPPHFYGVYTRDLFDSAVSWQAMMPRPKDGRMLGNPFGAPVAGPDEVVLFEVPRQEIGIPSIGYMRHLKLSEFGWHPSYAIGNSLADPRVGRKTTSPVLQSSREKSNHGWNQYLFGWADGRTSGRGPDYWAMLTRQILFERPTDHFVVYDLSYEVNFNLWDNFFVSTGSPSRKSDFLENPDENPLPNGRIGLYGSGSKVESDITDFHRAASQLWLEGGFNVHSVSKEAWKAVLATTADTGYGSEYAAPFPRLLNPPQGEWLDAGPEDKEATGGFRSLSDGDLDVLAEEIVREVKERAPFFGLSDFVNRRLVDDVHGEKGPIEAALSAAGVNAEFDTGPLKINNENDLPPVRFDNMSDATRLDQTLKPDSVAWGIPGYLTQGDILQVIGSTLRPRSDTFVVRAYGESVDGQGNVRARAWCEAIVQRTPEPVNPDVTGLNPLLEQGESFIDFGRRFRVSNFRWMGPDEV